MQNNDCFVMFFKKRGCPAVISGRMKIYKIGNSKTQKDRTEN